MAQPDWAMFAAAEQAIVDALRAEMDGEDGNSNCFMEYISACKRVEIFLARAAADSAEHSQFHLG